LFIDLRKTPSNLGVDKWLETPIRFNDGHWLYRNASENFDTRKIKDLYDGILFIERSTPVIQQKMHCTEAQRK
jgi:hypothetical protein